MNSNYLICIFQSAYAQRSFRRPPISETIENFNCILKVTNDVIRDNQNDELESTWNHYYKRGIEREMIWLPTCTRT